jgi:hypothetical protein
MFKAPLCKGSQLFICHAGLANTSLLPEQAGDAVQIHFLSEKNDDSYILRLVLK